MTERADESAVPAVPAVPATWGTVRIEDAGAGVRVLRFTNPAKRTP